MQTMAVCGAQRHRCVRTTRQVQLKLRYHLIESLHRPAPPSLPFVASIQQLPLTHRRTLNVFLFHRYNVSCSQHFKTSRGRTAAAAATPPAPTESTGKRRGPPRRSSSNASSKISGRHLLVKVWKLTVKTSAIMGLNPQLFVFLPFHHCFSSVSVQSNSESSRSEDVSSDGEEEDDSSSLSPSSSLSCSKPGQGAPPDSPAPCNQIEGSSFLSVTPAQWSVEEVFRFISSLQGKSASPWAGPPSLPHLCLKSTCPCLCSGCEELAAQFLSQEIDGQALLLLREEHLISTMNIKLGPALKICASINTLREWRQQSSQRNGEVSVPEGTSGPARLIKRRLISVWENFTKQDRDTEVSSLHCGCWMWERARTCTVLGGWTARSASSVCQVFHPLLQSWVQ